MFTLEEINNEVHKYNKYTSYEIPEFQKVEHDNSNKYFGEIRRNEIMNDNYIIHISDRLYDCPLEFQKSVIWHEATHLYNIINFKENENIEGIMKTYSEAHAESIQLRFLLHINPKQIVNQGTRFLIYETGKEELSIVTGNYINHSLQALNNFQMSKSPNDFDLFTNNFCYFCGYMMLKKRKDADKLASYAISLFSKYKTDLQLLYKSIIDKNFEMSSNIYIKMKSDATLQSFNNII